MKQIDRSWEVVFRPVVDLKKLYIELTNRCNLNCSMCYRHSWHSAEGDMNEKLFAKLLAEIAELPHLEEIVLGGLGEPLSHPEFWQWLPRLHAAHPEVALVLATNGVLLHPEQIPLLAKNGVARVIVSVDGADIAIQQELRGLEAGDLLDKLSALGQAFAETPGIIWWWETVFQRKNREQLLELIRLAGRFHVKHVVVSHLVPVNAEQSRESLFDPEMSPDDSSLLARARNTALLYAMSTQLPKTRLVTERKCNFVESSSAVIRWDGAVAPCYRNLHGCGEHYFGRKKDVPAFNFGNVHTERVADVWTKRAYQEFRFRVITSMYPSCPDCDFVEGCDVVNRADMDCDGGLPACGDCLWSRGMVICP